MVGDVGTKRERRERSIGRADRGSLSCAFGVLLFTFPTVTLIGLQLNVRRTVAKFPEPLLPAPFFSHSSLHTSHFTPHSSHLNLTMLRAITIQRVLAQSVATPSRGPSRVWPVANRLYSTSNFNSNPTSSSVDTRKAGSQQSNGRISGWIRRISLMSASAAAGAFVYAKADPSTIGGFSGLPIGSIQPTILTVEEPDQPFPSDIKANPEKLDEIKKSVLLEQQMQELDLVQEYKGKVKQGEWKMADPYWYLTKATRPHHLMAGTLRGENMLSVHPLKFERGDKKAIVLFMHLGRSLCGHDRIVHGGLLGTILGKCAEPLDPQFAQLGSNDLCSPRSYTYNRFFCDTLMS